MKSLFFQISYAERVFVLILDVLLIFSFNFTTVTLD